MKDKRFIIGVIAVMIAIVMGITGCGKKDDGASMIITLDINPSVELEIKSDKIVRATAVNEDAKEYVQGLEGKSLEESFDIIIKRAGENNLAEDGNITIILGMETRDNKVEETLKKVCDRNELEAYIIVPTITEEAKAEAKAHGVTPAKAAVIQEVAKEIEEVSFEDLIEKPAEELDEMKQTGRYCDEGYKLVGAFCEKAIREERPEESKVCPEGYEEVDNKCYLKGETTEEPYCEKGFELKNGKCVGTEKVDAKASCSTGTYNSKTGKCEVLTYVSDGTKTCRNQNMDPKDILVTSDKCSGGKWPHDDNTCEGADKFYPDGNGGWCYNPEGDYDATISCPSGSSVATGNKGKACYKIENSDPTYSCSKGTLNGTKCVVETTKNPEVKLSCTGNFELYKNRVCIDKNTTKEYIMGYTCNKDARLEDNHCVYYERIEAKGN